MSVLLLQMGQAHMKYRGYIILCGAVGSVSKLERIKHRREYWNDVVLHQPIEALHHYRRECNRTIILKHLIVDFLGTGIIIAVLKHDGTTAWSSEVLKMSVRTGASWSVHSFRTRCLLGVDFFQGPPDISCVKTKYLLILRNTFPCRSVIQCLKPSKIC